MKIQEMSLSDLQKGTKAELQVTIESLYNHLQQVVKNVDGLQKANGALVGKRADLEAEIEEKSLLMQGVQEQNLQLREQLQAVAALEGLPGGILEDLEVPDSVLACRTLGDLVLYTSVYKDPSAMLNSNAKMMLATYYNRIPNVPQNGS